jgi:hypothetical protein
MEKHLNDILLAVKSVNKEKYIDIIGTHGDNTEYEQIAENSFTAELYHQFRIIMDSPGSERYYRDLILNFDINKERHSRRPDLVLHRAQSNMDDQRMYIEVKTNPHAGLSDDLEKLFYATHPGLLKYQSGVMIVGKKDYQLTCSSIKRYVELYKKERCEEVNKLYLLHFAGKTSLEYTFDPFTDIIKKTIS